MGFAVKLGPLHRIWCAMPRFFFHVVDGVGTAEDEDGLVLDGVAAARDVAVEGARDILAAEIKYGSIDLNWRIDVADEGGAVVLTLPFSEAVLVTKSPD
jgi:hypothetical protein